MNNSEKISRDIYIYSLAGSTMVNTPNGTVSVDSVDNVDSVDSVGNHPLSREDQDDLLEASGNCIVNRNFQWPWLSTPFPDTLLPPVSHHVSMLKLDPFRIYDRETGEPIGIGLSHSTGPSQVDTALPGVDTVQYSGTQSQSDFESINLSTRESTPTTVYKVPVTVSSPLISDSKDKLKHSECDSKDGQISVRNIVYTVMFISICLFLLSVLSTLSSLRRETNRERMGDTIAHITQEKRIGHNNTVIQMSHKSDISGPLPTGKTKRGFLQMSTVTTTTTATDDATTTSSTTDTTTTSSSTDATTTSASTDATPTSFTIDTTANTATTATTTAPTPNQMLNTSPTPTAITNDANLLPPIPTPIPTPITRIHTHLTTSTTIQTIRTTTRTRRTGTTRRWYRWGD